MKNGKKPTRRQCDGIKSMHLDPENYLVVKDCPECFVLVHRVSGKARRLGT